MRLGATLLLLGSLLAAGCLQPTPAATTGDSVTAGTPYPAEAAFDTTGAWSRTLLPGPYGRLDVEELFMPSFDGTKIHMGVFRPDVPEGTRVPVIIDAGPYYLDGDEAATSDKTQRLGGFLIENFVPHGYAVAQVSVRGTGLSGGCVDYMGDKEQRDLDAVVTFLGEQEWSSGAIGMIGRSYDGSTPWEAATFGNPYLKTIVPISGITDLQQLHYRNGSSEARALSLGTLYYSFGATNAGLGGPEEDPARVPRMACLEGPQHAPMGAYGYATGGGHAVPGPTEAYWATRNFAPRVLENYEGSLFYIHGLQDWNVKPAQGVDVYNAFEGKKKALLGQWAHNYPDRPDEHEHLRWDWAEMLLRWFDQELKGVATDAGPDVLVEDHRGNWRAEPANAWPPQDATWLALHPTQNGTLVEKDAGGSMSFLAPGALTATGVAAPDGLPPRVLAFETTVFPEDTRISGQPRFHATVRTPTPGGNLWAELWEVPAEGEQMQIGRAQMDLRFANGGKTMSPATPNVPIMALMEFYPLDARILAGSKVVLLVTGEPESMEVLPNPMTSQMQLDLGDDLTTLELPLIARDFTPTRWDVADGKVIDETA